MSRRRPGLILQLENNLIPFLEKKALKTKRVSLPMKSFQMLCTAFYAKSGPIFAFRVTLKTFFKCKKSTDMMNEIPFNTLISACFFFSQTQPLFSSSYVQGLSYKVYLVLEIRFIYISDRKTPKCVGVFKTSRFQKNYLRS